MSKPEQCNVCNGDSGSEYELRLQMSEGGYREVSIVLCDVCRDEHLAAEVVEQQPVQPQL